MPPESIDKTQWGFDQASKPAPLWYRRLTNAIIICFLPVYTGFVDIIRMDDYERQIYLHIGVAIPFMLKGFAMIMGNGQVYYPTNKQIDLINKSNQDKDNLKSLLFIILIYLFSECIYSLLK